MKCKATRRRERKKAQWVWYIKIKFKSRQRAKPLIDSKIHFKEKQQKKERNYSQTANGLRSIVNFLLLDTSNAHRSNFEFGLHARDMAKNESENCDLF